MENQIVTPQQNIVTQPPSPSRRKPFIYILVAILFLIIVTAVAYTLGQRSERSKQVETVISPSPANQQPIQSTTTSKTYSNSKYNFSIKYPPNWKYLEVPNATYQTADDGVWLTDSTFPSPQTDARTPINIRIAKSDPSPDWKPDYYTDYKVEEYRLGNVTGKYISGKNKEGGFSLSVVIAQIGNVYIVAQPADQEPTTLQNFNKILSTFEYSGQLTTPTSAQNSSQLYTDPDNIYTISIPTEWSIDKQWERGTNVPDGLSYSRFQKNGEYMQLTISKLYSHTPEYPCRPQGGNPKPLTALNFNGYQSYDAYSGFNLDDKNQSTTSYTYCVNVKGKNLQIYFVPTSSNNNSEGIKVFYDILNTLQFK